MVMKAVRKPDSREGRLSGSITFHTICRVEQPMDWAASISPLSISRREDSTSRAAKGKAATVRGTRIPGVPMVVPRITRDRGMTSTMRMRKGTERSRLTTMFNACMRGAGRGRMPSLAPVTSTTPRGRPMR